MKNILLFSLILFASLSCRKDENSIIIGGTLVDAYTLAPVANRKIEISKAIPGFMGSKQVHMEDEKTDENGIYKFKFRPPSRDRVGGFYLDVENGPGHSIDYDSIEIGKPYILNMKDY